MRKIIAFLLFAGIFVCSANAQVGIIVGPRYGYGPGGGYYQRGYPRRRQGQPNYPSFKPTVNVSFGYGFPNVDQYQLPQFYNYYKGSLNSQMGPITGAVDYQFSRFMSVGILATHGTVNAPYYSYGGNGNTTAFTGSLDNWSIMFNLMSYIPVNNKNIVPYFRTAIGVNIWQQNFNDASGNNVNLAGTPSDLAYQIGFGSKFFFTKTTGLFIEAGYGKYILQGGLTFRF
ncbi:hypothetical protein ACI6Q2_09475 [Chitinophagaceae bacterium LWZ2-11]